MLRYPNDVPTLSSERYRFWLTRVATTLVGPLNDDESSTDDVNDDGVDGLGVDGSATEATLLGEGLGRLPLMRGFCLSLNRLLTNAIVYRVVYGCQ